MAEYVTKINKEKTSAVEELKELFKQSADYIFTDYRGLSVAQITELREPEEQDLSRRGPRRALQGHEPSLGGGREVAVRLRGRAESGLERVEEGGVHARDAGLAGAGARACN